MSDSELKTPEQIAEELWSRIERSRGIYHPNDKQTYLNSITAAISAERQRAEKLLEALRQIADIDRERGLSRWQIARAAIDEFEKGRG